jgi:5-methylcytosine-specific restriction endonuclease McrA
MDWTIRCGWNGSTCGCCVRRATVQGLEVDMIAFAKKAFWRVCFGCGEWFSTSRKEGCYCRVCHSENVQRPRRTVRFCAWCGKPFIPKPNNNAGKCCSRECGFKYQRKIREDTRVNHPHTKVKVITCEVCDKLFIGHGERITASVCSDDCMKEQARRKSRLHNHGREEYSHGVVVCACGRVEVYAKWFRGATQCRRCKRLDARRKWRKTVGGKASRRAYRKSEKGKSIAKSGKKHYKHVKRMATPGRTERVELSDIMGRDGGRCQLCGCKVKMPTGTWSKQMATLDHIIPLSRGGAHTMDNVQLACAQCNSTKGAKRKGQLRLIG